MKRRIEVIIKSITIKRIEVMIKLMIWREIQVVIKLKIKSKINKKCHDETNKWKDN